MIRRVFDVLLAGVGLVLASPIIGVAAVAIRWQSPGPVFFGQVRVGLGGREFRIWKLRSMVTNAERHGLLTASGDSRVTPFGRVLRRWKLDELPQLSNVIRGDMSLVGPRPEVPHIVAGYSPEQRLVLSVRPGITGPTQLLWRREEECYPRGVDTEDYYLAEILPRKLATDLEYVRTRSLGGDVVWLWRTGRAMLLPRLAGPAVSSEGMPAGRGAE